MTDRTETDPSRRAYEIMIDYLDGEIKADRLHRGDILPPERQLAAALGISRNSMREALQTLNVMGFITRRQGSGNYLSYNFKAGFGQLFSLMHMAGQMECRQFYELRQALELEALFLASRNITPAALAELQDFVSRLNQGDKEITAEQAVRQHEIIVEASGSPLLIQLWHVSQELLEDCIYKAIRRVQADAQTRDRLHNGHRRILRGLEQQDLGIGCQALREHHDLVRAALPAVSVG